MVSLMQRAEAWGRAVAAGRGAHSETSAEEEESSGRLGDAPFGGLGA